VRTGMSGTWAVLLENSFSMAAPSPEHLGQEALAST
jgi:hypothetical protein